VGHTGSPCLVSTSVGTWQKCGIHVVLTLENGGKSDNPPGVVGGLVVNVVGVSILEGKSWGR